MSRRNISPVGITLLDVARDNPIHFLNLYNAAFDNTEWRTEMRNPHRHQYHRISCVAAELRVCTICNKTERAIALARKQKKPTRPIKKIDPWDMAMEQVKRLAGERYGHNFAFIYREPSGAIKVSQNGYGVCYGSYPYIHPALSVDRDGRATPEKGTPIYFLDAAFGRFYTKDKKLHGSSYNCPGRNGAAKTNWATLKDYEKEYVEWALNDSPFASAFLIKDPEFVVNYGSIMDATLPVAFVLSAGVMFRWVTESPKQIRIKFWKMFKDKIGPEMALFMSQICKYDIDSFEKGTLSLLISEDQAWNHGHGIFMPCMSKNGMIRYLTHDLSALEGQETMETQCHYAGRHKAWTIDQTTSNAGGRGRYLDGGRVTFPAMKGRPKTNSFGDEYTEYYWPDNDVASWVREFIKINNLKGKLCLSKEKSAS